MKEIEMIRYNFNTDSTISCEIKSSESKILTISSCLFSGTTTSGKKFGTKKLEIIKKTNCVNKIKRVDFTFNLSSFKKDNILNSDYLPL